MIRKSLLIFNSPKIQALNKVLDSSIRHILCGIFASGLFTISHNHSAHADTITETAPLDFGTIAIKSNASTYTVRVRYTGQIINDPEIIIVSPGTPAEYFLSSFPASTLLTISVTSLAGVTTSPISPIPGNEQFNISNFDYLPSISTDVNGEATIYVGATLTTSGSGIYDDTLYVTTLNLTITY